MAKIIERGAVPEKLRYRHRCSKCHSLIEYTMEDTRSARNEMYVECPVCREWHYWTSVKANGPVDPQPA